MCDCKQIQHAAVPAKVLLTWLESQVPLHRSRAYREMDDRIRQIVNDDADMLANCHAYIASVEALKEEKPPIP